ncbi:hypothetical protein [Paenibacillus lemnae]|uniref:DUF4878 domain-containing protein n=1 Tax=Paenibacillus lemnae TaxID=1330551 RepID=A0A848M894_PAELE|nr:hypothetical protein [Paenibacillus lemnae]NMO97428.1 hypothetical protein [Paenibacillus lemnae]
MDKRFGFLFIIAVVIVASSFFYFNTTSQASPPDEKEVKEIFEKYFDAIEKGDVDTAIGLVIDTRYQDIGSQRAGYQTAVKEDVIYSIEIDSIDQGDSSFMSNAVNKRLAEEYEDRYFVDLAVENKTNGEFKITMPIVKNQGEWKILILPTEIPAA